MNYFKKALLDVFVGNGHGDDEDDKPDPKQK